MYTAHQLVIYIMPHGYMYVCYTQSSSYTTCIALSLRDTSCTCMQLSVLGSIAGRAMAADR